MSTPHDPTSDDVTIHDLYPDFTEAELLEAEDRLRRYLELMLRMYERIRSDPENYSHFRSLLGR